MSPKAYFLFFLSFSFFTCIYAQSNVIEGIVKDINGKPIAGVTLNLRGKQVTSNPVGLFSFLGINQGDYTLKASALGYNPFEQKVTKSSDPLFLNITLSNDVNQIGEITIIGKSELERVRQQAIRAVVVDTRAVADQPVSLAELMNRAPGIRIRQSGGLGNQVDVSINGFQGNSVQYFRNGIPLEYLGGGYGINNVPINQLAQVEVYKGVVPVTIGGDALGGAVNLVTHRKVGTSADASLEVASFNTKIANLSVYHQDAKKDWFVGIDAFYNQSDNNYKAEVEVTNAQANPVPVTVPLFHNGYKHYFAEIYTGVVNRSWADEFQLSFATYDIERESQHPALMTNPYGALKVYNKGFIPAIRYKKGLLGNKMQVDHFMSYSHFNRSRVDTIQGTFDWYGTFTPRNNGIKGESPTASLADIDFRNFISRTSLSFQLNPQHNFDANFVFNYNDRLGSDPLGFRFMNTDIDILSKKAEYQKSILGISWESRWMDNRLTNQLFAKHFSFKSTGINAFLSNDRDINNYKTAADQNFGIGNAIKFQLNKQSFIRGSIELTNRLPQLEELFGNNDTRAPNFQLKPERSLNINLGYRRDVERYTVEINTFYRKTQGMILLVPIQSPFSQFQNLDSIQGYGFDVDVRYKLHETILLSGNLTWQDNRMIDVSNPIYKWIEGTRLRNTPFFFTNFGINGNYKNLLSKNDQLKPYILYNFIREFYLLPVPRDKEPDGLLGIFGRSGVAIKDLVPDQHLVTAGFNYSFPQSKIAIGIEAKNIFDEKLYDYYKVQRPGRSFHIKLNYHFSKQ